MCSVTKLFFFFFFHYDIFTFLLYKILGGETFTLRGNDSCQEKTFYIACINGL